jgi:ATP-dependent Clp protease protease subunit
VGLYLQKNIISISKLFTKGKNFLPFFVFLSYNQIMIIPTVLEKSATGERAYDLYSRLLKDRIIFLGEDVNEHSMNLCIMQMLFLDREDPHMPIEFYINSPGGSVVDGLALYDVMHTISAPVNTTCVGTAASMGAILLTGGTGTRSALPHSRIMIHQVSSGYRGTAADINIQVKETNKLYDQLLEILSQKSGQTVKKLRNDCDRDYYMSAEEAKAYGLIDSVIESKKNGTNS